MPTGPTEHMGRAMAYEAQAQKLVQMFADNFGQYGAYIDEDVKAVAIG